MERMKICNGEQIFNGTSNLLSISNKAQWQQYACEHAHTNSTVTTTSTAQRAQDNKIMTQSMKKYQQHSEHKIIK